MPADIPYREVVDAEPVILAIVATETVVRNPVAVVAPALLPSAVLRLPATCTITSPRNLLLPYLCWTPSLYCNIVPSLTLLVLSRRGLLLLLLPCGVGLLLTLLALLVPLPLGLLLLFCRVVPLLTLLLLPRRGLLLLLLPRGVGLLLTLLALLVPLPLGLLLLFCRVVPLLALLVLLPLGLLLLCRVVLPLALLVLLPLGLLLLFRLGLSLLFGGLSLFFLLVWFVLARASRSGDSEQQKKRGRSKDSN